MASCQKSSPIIWVLIFESENVRRYTLIWTIAGSLLIGPLATDSWSRHTHIFIQQIAFENAVCNALAIWLRSWGGVVTKWGPKGPISCRIVSGGWLHDRMLSTRKHFFINHSQEYRQVYAIPTVREHLDGGYVRIIFYKTYIGNS